MIFDGQSALLITISALAVSIVAITWLTLLEMRFRKIFRGPGVGDMRNVLIEIQDGLRYFSKKEKEIDSFLEHVEERLTRSAQHLGVVRFNPYEGIGGEQSFSIAVLDEKKNGFVVSGLYGRDQSRIYAKPIENCMSTYQLSNEEKEAIEKAVGRYA